MRAVRHKGEIARSTTVLNTESSPTQYPPLPNAYYEATTEKQFQQDIIDAARLLGWLVYHTWNSIHSAKGYPDLHLIRPPRSIFVEVKSEKGKVKQEQQQWLDMLEACGYEVYVWRPSNIDEIITILQRTS